MIIKLPVREVRAASAAAIPGRTVVLPDNGTSFDDLVAALTSRTVSAESLPPIRVVREKGVYYALDYALFEACRVGLVREVTVQVWSLDDDAVRAELDAHRRTAERPQRQQQQQQTAPGGPSNDQFESGAYKFNGIVLQWTVDDLKKPAVDVDAYRKRFPKHAPEWLLTRGSTEKQSWAGAGPGPGPSPSPGPGSGPGPSPGSGPSPSAASPPEAVILTEGVRAAYFDQYLPLILEETRTMLHDALEGATDEERFTVSFYLESLPKNAGNPSVLSFAKPAGVDISIGDTFLCESLDRPGALGPRTRTRFLAITSFVDYKRRTDRVKVKAILGDDFSDPQQNRRSWSECAAQLDGQWQLTPLGCVVSHTRMYDVCDAKPLTVLDTQLITGDLSQPTTYRPRPHIERPTPKRGSSAAAPTGPMGAPFEDMSEIYDLFGDGPQVDRGTERLKLGKKRGVQPAAQRTTDAGAGRAAAHTRANDAAAARSSLTPAAESALASLNQPQRAAVQDFLDMTAGIKLVQGPPGTGKTSTIVVLLQLLAEKRERTLVCAPSNKAVQILAQRLFNKLPNVPMVLAGVDEQLPEDSPLRSVFLHAIGDELLDLSDSILAAVYELCDWDWETNNNNSGNSSNNNSNDDDDAKTRAGPAGSAGSVRSTGSKAAGSKAAGSASSTPSGGSKATGSKAAAGSAGSTPSAGSAPSAGSKADDAGVVVVSESHRRQVCERVAEAQARIFHVLDLYCIDLKLQTDVLDHLRAPTDVEALMQPSTVRAQLSRILRDVEHFQSQLKAASDDWTVHGLDGQILTNAEFVFCTLSVSGRSLVQAAGQRRPFTTVIVDEAGQSIEPETLIPLACKPDRLLLIGDTKQLPATVNSQLNVKLQLDRSLMSRLLDDCKQPHHLLKVQHRMHPEIRFWPSERFYGGRLEDHASITAESHTLAAVQQKMLPQLRPCAFFNVNGTSRRGQFPSRSLENAAEARFVASLLYNYQAMGIDIPTQVGVITFYKGQERLLQRNLELLFPGVRVKTVDGFQGGEEDIIVVSCVRAQMSTAGFLNDFRRLNVAITRARFVLHIVGHAETLETQDNDVRALVRHYRETGRLHEASDFTRLINAAPAPALSDEQFPGLPPRNAAQPVVA